MGQQKQLCGERAQIDDSHHDGFEERGPWCVLMGYIEDATMDMFGRFDEEEERRLFTMTV